MNTLRIQIEVKIIDPNGGMPTHMVLSEGDYFGELALQGNFRSAANLTAGRNGIVAMSTTQAEFAKSCGTLNDLFQAVR
jgi:CRP-like cAMP-binding protein